MASDSGSYNDISRDAVLDTDDGRDPFVMASDSGSYNDISRDAVLDTDDRRGNEQEKTSQGIDDYKKYTERMPSELKYNIFDILLLHSEEDLSKAEAFQESIQSACKVKVEGKLRSPEVQLENEIKYFTQNPAKSLDVAIDKAHFIFLFVTENFCEEDLSLYKGYACLTDALEKKKFNVFPVKTEDSKTMKEKKYKLPVMLKELRSFEYWDEKQCLSKVAQLIESNVSSYEDMVLALEGRRQEYFYKNKDKLTNNCQVSFVGSSCNPSTQYNDGPILEEDGKLNKSGSKGHSDGESTVQHRSLGHYKLQSNPDQSSVAYDSIPRNSQSRRSVNSTPSHFELSQGIKDSDLPGSADLSSSSQPTSRVHASSSLPKTDRTEVKGSGTPTVHHHHTHIENIQSVKDLDLGNTNFNHTDNPDEKGGGNMSKDTEEENADSIRSLSSDASEQIGNFQKVASTNCESTPNNEQKAASTYYEPRPNAEQRAAGTNMPVNRVEPFQKMRPSDEQGALPFVSPDQMIKKEQTLPIASQDQVMNKELRLPFMSPDQMSKKEQ